MLFGLRNTETEESLYKDPDVQLLPRIIEKVILPKLNRKTIFLIYVILVHFYS